MVEDGAFSHKIDYVTIFLGDSKSQRASNLHYWFKSYNNFAEWVDFAYWWSFSGGRSAINGATPTSFRREEIIISLSTPGRTQGLL